MKKHVFAALLCALLALCSAALADYRGFCDWCGTYQILEFVSAKYIDADRHEAVFLCPNCKGETTLRMVHYGGTATCTQAAVCEACRSSYGQPLGHDYAWQSNGNGTHTGTCQRDGCGDTVENQPCTGGTATCTAGKLCEVCGGEYTEPLDHDYAWQYNGDGTHTGTCQRDGCGDTVENQPCTGGEATCTAGKLCEVCGGEYTEPLGHDYAWQYNGDGTHTGTRQRNGCGDVVENQPCTGGEATCTAGKLCEVCGGEYTEPAGHVVVTIPAEEPTCTEDGHTSGAYCSACNVTLRETETLSSLSHWYGEWTPNGDGTHSAECRRCEYRYTVGCETTAIPAAGEDEGAEEIAFCPVCGAVSTDERLEMVEGARIAALNGSLPRGELVVRMGTLGDGRSVLSVAMEYAGKLEQPRVEVEISIPGEACARWNPAPFAADGALSGDWNLQLYDEAGALQEVACAAQEAALTFRADFTPVEGEEDAPCRLYLLPAASN